jgi:anti-sigma regulatory factor (Ser/Thr protein kinase)
MQPTIIAIVDASQVGEARRAGLKLAESLNWDETLRGKLSIIVTETGTNLAKHAKQGQIHLRIFDRDGWMGIEVLAIDRGPGVKHIEDCLKDGYSTAGSSGTGLGAITRLAEEFDIFSQEGRGTCMVARLLPSSRKDANEPRGRGLLLGSVQVPVQGETECGDSWGMRSNGRYNVILLADGLGHGPEAAKASREAVAMLARTREFAPLALLENVHAGLRSSRGAAVAIAHIDTESGQVRFSGAGNISATLVNAAGARHMISHNGTVGHNIHKFQEFVYPWGERTLLVMHSDGVTTSWRLDEYPGLAQRDPSLIAAVLYRDASRGRDDVCVVVGRER